MSPGRPVVLVSLLLTLCLVATACGEDGRSESTGAGGAEPDKGGTLVIGAEQEPRCADWVSSCAGASWGVWTIQAFTMPRSYDVTEDARRRASPLLTGEPRLEQGPPMKVTYQISEQAVWSDGTPITSSDFKYTWQQIMTGTDIFDRTGYEDIATVDDSRPKSVVVTYKQPYAAWEDLFGGFYGIYPKHLLEGKDRNAEMKDGYTFSGGPWIIAHWTKGQEVKLVPNPRYWGTRPRLDAVVFRYITDTAAYQQAYKTGQVAAIYPQAQPEVAQLKGLPDTRFDVATGLQYEALWFNAAKPPLDSKAVRLALAYATDRRVIVSQLFGPVQPGIEPIEAFMTPANEEWYSRPFTRYRRDLARVDQLMHGDGWAKGADGIWAKGGQRAALELATTAGNHRRELTQQIVQSQWKDAGFEVRANNPPAATLIGDWLPQGAFQVALYAQQPPSTDPGLCPVFCSKNIPSPANAGSGQNYTRLASPVVDELWQRVDRELDRSKRKALVDQGHAALADELPGLPIDPFPDIVVYNSTKVSGPVGHNFVYGPFWNVHLWSCRGGSC
ncbi:MAG: ABC transporter substrate-binding protein [Actinomycetota bacterium]|nr:ABC transporter substrate-binding protein [Actinomycetota bacterium]